MSEKQAKNLNTILNYNFRKFVASNSLPDECILDPSLLPYLSEFSNSEYKTIFLPDTFLQLIEDPDLFEDVISIWTRKKPNLTYVIDTLTSKKLGKSKIKFITQNDVDPKIYSNFFESVKNCYEVKQKATRRAKKISKNNDKEKSRKEKILGLASDIGGKVAGFAHKSGNVIIGFGKGTWNIAKKGVGYVIDGSNKFVKKKKKYFDKLTGKKRKKTTGIRWVGGVILVIFGPATGYLSIPPGLTLMGIDP